MRALGPGFLEARRCSEGPPGSQGPALAALFRAAQRLQLRRDFPAALAACERGLELEQKGSGSVLAADTKSCLCIIGIQALAELNQWDQVLGWVLEIYEIPEKIPARILQMCIILYSKVGEPGQVQKAVDSWLKRCTSPSPLGCGSGLVLELYLLHVLLPLGLYTEAEELIQGTALLTEQQRGPALQVIQNRRPQQPEQDSAGSRCQLAADSSQQCHPVHNSLFKTLQQVLMLSWRFLHLVPVRKLFLAALLAYMLIVRLDPASPAALPWVRSLHNVIRQMWKTMFARFNKARIGK
ncbi:peroxisome assembly protein 26 [Rhincodon typus]|uniref:peroxisome assembly protein 26 n=1 Tax=Rhincodon typus TaxID=259920 RepID=UPI00202E0F30|nr:peroxisome assembly protein 26 [Rhincodon typus]